MGDALPSWQNVVFKVNGQWRRRPKPGIDLTLNGDASYGLDLLLGEIEQSMAQARGEG